MKRFLSVFLVLMMTLTLISVGEAAEEEPALILVESLYFDAVPRDLKAVEDAINAITIPEINVKVELYPLGISEASSQVSLMISSGSQLDLVVSLGRTEFQSLFD